MKTGIMVGARLRKPLKLFAVLLPVAAIGFVIAEHLGWWDRFLGLDHVLVVAGRLETSYAPDVLRDVVPGDDAWEPLLGLIRRYSNADLPRERRPLKIARHVAIASAKIDIGPGRIAEWTVPTTPVFLLYRDWPAKPGTDATPIGPSDYRIVGTIGDLRTWVDKRRADFNFLTRDILIGFTGVILGLWIWLFE